MLRSPLCFSFFAALTTFLALPALAHAEPAPPEPPPLRWGVGLSGGVAGVGIAERFEIFEQTGPRYTAGGISAGVAGELGLPFSRRASFYWAPSFLFVAGTDRSALFQQNAFIFEWTPSDNWGIGIGPSLDFGWVAARGNTSSISSGSTYGESSASWVAPMGGLDLRSTATFGPRDGRPRMFLGVAVHLSTGAPLAQMAGSATLTLGVHSF